MSPAAVVVVCALELLGRSADRLPPIRILDAPPPGVSANAQAFADLGEGVMYLIASAPAFREAELAERSARGRGQCAARSALKMIASLIVHEQWHLEHGRDERGAYEAQLTELNRLGLGAGTWANGDVQRSMRAVLDARSRAARRP